MENDINKMNKLALSNFRFESKVDPDQLKSSLLGVINFDEYEVKSIPNSLAKVSHPYSPAFNPNGCNVNYPNIGTNLGDRSIRIPQTDFFDQESLNNGNVFRRLTVNKEYTHLLLRECSEDTLSLIFKSTSHPTVDNEIRPQDKVYKEIYKIKDGKIEFYQRIDGKYVPPKPASYEF